MTKDRSCQILSLVPGRMRLHLHGWTADQTEWIQNRLCGIDGLRRMQTNPRTRNVLIHYDRQITDSDKLIGKINEVLRQLPGEDSATVDLPDRQWTADAGSSFMRIGIRGLLGHAVVDTLWFGVGFLGSEMGLPLTGLGPLHVFIDVAVWTLVLTGEQIAPHRDRA